MDFSEKWGTDIEEAVKLALADLKLERDEVEVTVLEQPTKGFFGIGSKLAKVRVEKKKPIPAPEPEAEEKEIPRPAGEKKEIPAAEAKPEKRPEKKPARKSENHNKKSGRKEKRVERVSVAGERPADLVPVTDHAAITFLKEVTENMGLSLNISAMVNDDSVYVDIDGKDSGTVIGKRGQTLDAVQYLTSLVVNKGESKKYIRVVVDAENYRAKRERTLEQLADRLADKVVRTKKSVRLEPMNPYERKVIHAALQSNPSVTTRSEGEEPYRRVIIELK